MPECDCIWEIGYTEYFLRRDKSTVCRPSRICDFMVRKRETPDYLDGNLADILDDVFLKKGDLQTGRHQHPPTSQLHLHARFGSEEYMFARGFQGFPQDESPAWGLTYQRSKEVLSVEPSEARVHGNVRDDRLSDYQPLHNNAPWRFTNHTAQA